MRRLIIALLLFIDDHQVRMMLGLVFCLISLVHHMMVEPFKLKKSNTAETFSLSLLILFTAINLLKSVDGNTENFRKIDNHLIFILVIIENLMSIILILFILTNEFFSGNSQ